MKADVTLSGAASVVPFQAMVFYASPDSGGRRRDLFATLHGVEAVKGAAPRLLAGQPISLQAMKAIAREFGDQLKLKPQVLRERVLLSTDDLLLWWLPPCKRLCFFDIDWHEGTEGRDRLQGVSAQLPMPGLVFSLRRTRGAGIWQGVNVFAVEGERRPSGETPVFRAPLLNLNDDGLVCWGSGKVPARRTQDDIEQWEDAFFGSTFSHYNQSSPFKGCSGYGFLAEMVTNPSEQFPRERLIPMGLTLQKLAERLCGAAHA